MKSFFQNTRISKRPSTNNLNEDFNESTFKTKVLYFLLENNISFRAVTNKRFKELLNYTRK